VYSEFQFPFLFLFILTAPGWLNLSLNMWPGCFSTEINTKITSVHGPLLVLYFMDMEFESARWWWVLFYLGVCVCICVRWVLEPHLLLLINICAGAGISSHVSFSIFLRSLRRQSLLASAVPEH